MADRQHNLLALTPDATYHAITLHVVDGVVVAPFPTIPAPDLEHGGATLAAYFLPGMPAPLIHELYVRWLRGDDLQGDIES